MRRASLVSLLFAFAVPLFAQRVVDPDGRVLQLFPTKDKPSLEAAKPEARVINLTYHGGPTITSAKVVSIFWGSAWQVNGSPSALAVSIMDFFNQYGTTGEYNVITQYSGIQESNLGNAFWIDTVNPSSTAVTDAMVQAEVIHAFTAGGVAIDASTIYEVFLPNGYYAQIGSATSCGGPHLQFCAYHSNFSYNGNDVKYSSMPYPSCGGCQWTGWTTAQNFDHFACHETREAVTDPDGNAWFDRSGNEADDKCAWSPSPFIGAGGFGYQYEWSNANHGCVQTK
ncbi:MAG TPA: hypothetical protein VKG23_14490 [Thermoanaerobaculia bacterium]|nr:hypothetical protein [Thermoanaerobaculia bacterium]